MRKYTVGEVIEMQRARQKAAVNRMLGLPVRPALPAHFQPLLEILCSFGGEDWPCAGSETYEYRPSSRGKIE